MVVRAHGNVTESKLLLLATQPASKSRWAVGTRNSNSIWKTSRPRRWWTRVPKNHLTQVRIQASFILKGEGVWPLVAIFVLAAVH